MANYRCPTLGDCDRANTGEIFEKAPGDDLKCPQCGTTLEQIGGVGADTSAGPAKKGPVGLIVGGVLMVALVGGGLTWFLAAKKKATAPPTPPTLAQLPPPTATPAPSPGIAPSEAETNAKRTAGEKDLVSGNAANAEKNSNRAAADELIKLAISKLHQGKLAEVERDLMEAKARDPKHPLVYYNLAILRLREKRTDDAIGEFERSFECGFTYFDRMDQDPDLAAIRNNPKFKDMIKRYRTASK